ncbi:MAG TPA: DUF1272 domain-containing protein [Dongiaceae bacterium]|jgi:hypothetical protein|nr:DUF1272 domain-containing protein [Dongiaceae bacterium]
MSLEMRSACEKCGTGLPEDSPSALICSHECTWCDACGAQMDYICPNCGGEIVRRPRRVKK